MKAHKHFRDASAWIAKAPPLPNPGQQLADGIVLQFPSARIRKRRNVGLAGKCLILRPSTSQAWRWRNRSIGGQHAG